MAYTKVTIEFPNVIEVYEYHSAKYGAPGEKRKKKRNPTPEEIEKRNQYNRVRLARWKLRNNFDVNDRYTTLTFRKEQRPLDMKEAKTIFSKFIRKVRKEYRKRGYELKWMRNIEVTHSNNWHIHLVVNRIGEDDIIIKKCWPYAKTLDFKLLYEKGEFKDLAKYLTKTPKTDEALREADYSTSRNLPVPEPKKKIYHFWKTWKKVKVPKGYYVEKDSLHEDTNDITGYKYRSYTLIRLKRQKIPECLVNANVTRNRRKNE